MYGFLQAGLLEQQFLEEQWSKHGYVKSEPTPSLWKQKWRQICSTLVVDDLRVKYQGKEHANQLISVLKEHHEIAEYREGKNTLDSHLIGTIKDENSTSPCQGTQKDQCSVYTRWNIQEYTTNYGVRKQYTEPEDEAPKLNK